MESKSFTRAQILKVLEILELDPGAVQEINIGMDFVTVTEKQWITVSREEKIGD